MPTWMSVMVSIAVLLIAGWIIFDRRRTEAKLQSHEILARQLRERALDTADQRRFLLKWKQCQALFVDDPAGAVEEADKLLLEVMRTRGYAADNPHERTKDIVAAYPEHAEKYRQAGEILERDRRSPVPTRSLRRAFLDYRDLFDDLVGNYEEELQRAS